LASTSPPAPAQPSLATTLRHVIHHLGPLPTLAATASAGLLALGGAIAYGHLIERHWLDVTRLTIELPALPKELGGIRIAQLSDFHQGLVVDWHGSAAQAIAACNAEDPDVVVLTGDFVVRRGGVPALGQLLAQLRPRPAFAVLGNHDYRFGRAHLRALADQFAALGITLLDNRVAAIERNGQRLWFIGVGDGYTSHDRFGEATLDLDQEDRPRILLTHYPDLIFDLPIEEIDLALAGHTHGAQVHLPFLAQQALRRSETTFASGLYWPRGVPLYVNRGLGTSGYPIRLGARPELTILTLVGDRT
jgi:predicted MPP superfamily phosphohydrolase